ncbi:phage protein Gp36 family protein [uncultured Rikenella sp.]|uniref:phage protein Gp36 family protein n=1 Tax=uncultured Rikenella sp. TaxID=368003 RepID=UPI002615D2BC|nr:phage protein Gp36 family protein [uncultured Rikenella sp.]
MFITQEEMQTHLRAEHAELIARGDDTILAAALDGAIAEACGYLGRFDTDRIFTATGGERNALLVIFVKDIAVWHFINLCGAGNYYENRKFRYERAVAWLRGVQRGEITPDFPRRTDDTGKTSTPFQITSNAKRGTHF